MNRNPRKEFLKPIRTTERAREIGRKGGIASGKARRERAEKQRFFRAYMDFSNFIESLTDAEYQEFIADFTEEEKEYIRFHFRPNKEDSKKWNKLFKQYF